jgi:hypothetical protein
MVFSDTIFKLLTQWVFILKYANYSVTVSQNLEYLIIDN